MTLVRDLGPIVRALAHRKGAFALVVLELAASFTIVSCLLLTARWYDAVGSVQTSQHEDELIEVTAHRPATSADAARAAADARAFQEDLRARLAMHPHVQAVARVSTTLLDSRNLYPSAFRVLDGASPAGGVTGLTLEADAALPEVLGLTLVEGRFPRTDRAGEAPERAALLTRCLRDGLFPGGSAVGRHVASGELQGARVVGVVEDVYLRPPFVVNAQCVALVFGGAGTERDVRFLLRVPAERRAQVAASLAAALVDRTPGAITEVKEYKPEHQRHRRLTRGLLITITLVGVNTGLVALLGALAVSSFLVAERTRQIGVRRALGATSGDIIRHFLLESTLAGALGTAAGLLLTLLFMLMLKRAYHSMALDPTILGITAVILWLDATAAALLPALRAARIPPSVAARTI